MKRLSAPGRTAKAEFDALLLPLGGDQLKQTARQIKAAGAGADKVQLLGSGLWDDRSIAGEPALYGGWFAASPPEQRREFESRFQATYGHPPPRLASLAFDAAALAAVLAKRRARPVLARGDPEPERLYRRRRVVPLHRSGLVQRGLAVLEVRAARARSCQPGAAEFRELVY